MIDQSVFEDLQAKIDEETAIRDVSISSEAVIRQCMN